MRAESVVRTYNVDVFSILFSHALYFVVFCSFSPLASLLQDVAKQLRDQQMVMKGHRDDALVHVSAVGMVVLLAATDAWLFHFELLALNAKGAKTTPLRASCFNSLLLLWLRRGETIF